MLVVQTTGPLRLLLIGYHSSFPRVKMSECDVYHSPSSNAKVRNKWSMHICDEAFKIYCVYFTVFCPLISYDWYLLPYWYTLYIHGVHYSVVQKWITVSKGNVIIVADFWLEYFSVQWICNDTNINSSPYTRWQSPLFEIVQKWSQDLYSKKGSDCEV